MLRRPLAEFMAQFTHLNIVRSPVRPVDVPALVEHSRVMRESFAGGFVVGQRRIVGHGRKVCRGRGRPFQAQRRDATTCGPACRQRVPCRRKQARLA